MSEKLKPLVIYHANCADGFGAAFAAWLEFGDNAEYVPTKYGQLDLNKDEIYDRLINYHDGHRFSPMQLEGRDVYVLDFSFSRETMNHLFTYAKRVVWLDHHKTAFEMWCGGIPAEGVFENVFDYNDAKDYIRLDNNRSGAMIAWHYFHSGKEVPMLIKHIDDYDRWQFKLEGTKEFNKALWSYAPWSFEQWERKFDCMDVVRYEQHIAEGAAILRAHDQNVAAVVKGAAKTCFIHSRIHLSSELRGLAANCPPHLSSDVGHQLANQSGTYGLLWYINKGGKCLCSLRSNGDYDVSAIAKSFGGGGHKNAAGFEVDIQTLLGWIK